MKAQPAILWDFDGTILPIEPFDSEQTLLLHHSRALSWHWRVLARLAITVDVREWSATVFKRVYIRCMTGCHRDRIRQTGKRLAASVSESCRETIHGLHRDGHPMIVISCGTADVIEAVLAAAGIHGCFAAIGANAFVTDDETVTGFDWKIRSPEGKVAWAQAGGIDLSAAVAIGDGYTDLPLLDRAGIPVMIDRSDRRRSRYPDRGYHFIRRIRELPALLAREAKTSGRAVNRPDPAPCSHGQEDNRESVHEQPKTTRNPA
jgi:phosphoserine phosphatase